MLVAGLLYVLLLSAGLGAGDLLLSRRDRPFRLALYVLFSGVWSVAVGLGILRGALVGEARRAPVTGAAWILAWTLGFLVVGASAGLALRGLILGVELLRRRAR